jgi:hypothetical protein
MRRNEGTDVKKRRTPVFVFGLAVLTALGAGVAFASGAGVTALRLSGDRGALGARERVEVG